MKQSKCCDKEHSLKKEALDCVLNVSIPGYTLYTVVCKINKTESATWGKVSNILCGIIWDSIKLAPYIGIGKAILEKYS